VSQASLVPDSNAALRSCDAALAPSILSLAGARGRDVNTLVVRWQTAHDRAALDALVLQFMPLVRNLARRYGRSSAPMEDLVQVGSVGLVKAINRFDVARGLRLQSYAIPTILGELRRFFRDTGWGVHVPRGAQERALAIRAAEKEITNRTGRPPTAAELAEDMQLDIEDVIDGLQVLHAYEPRSLEAPGSDEREDAPTLGETLGGADPNYEAVEQMTVIGAALGRLNEREREILKMRFSEDLTQSEIGARVGVSQMQVSRTLRDSLEKLRTTIETPEPLRPDVQIAAAGAVGRVRL
jgi:RNA polymerase sigma-B factor